MNIFLFPKEKYKKLSEYTLQSIITTSCLYFPSQVYYFSHNWTENGAEVAGKCLQSYN